MKCIKKTLLFFSCFVWTQQLLSLSNLSFLQNIHKERILKRKNTQSTPNDKQAKQAKQQCPICGKSLSTKRSLDKHLSDKICQRNYTCTILPCDGSECFISKDSLTDHMKAYKGKHFFQCPLIFCKAILSNQGNLIRHREKHSLEKRIKCPLCSKIYQGKDALAYHKKKDHKSTTLSMCKICKCICSDKDSLMKHLKTHTNPFSCLFCIAHPRYAFQDNLNRHIREEHFYYKCKAKDCDESFILGSLLFQHSEEQHCFPFIQCFECSQPFHGLLTFYQHEYIEHKKCDKNTFIKFLKDFITKDLRASYPFCLTHPFFNSLFLEKEVLVDELLSNLEKTSKATIPIKHLELYKQFIEKIISENTLKFEELSVEMLLSYECYRLYFSHDSAIGLLFLKDILSIMIQNRKPLETTYKEMLDRLYRKQFTDEEYDLFMLQFKKIFFEKITISEQSIIYKKDFSSSGTLQSYEKDGLKTESIVIDKTLEYPNISLQESMNPKQWDDQSGVSKEYLLPPEQVVIGGEFPSVNTVCTNEYDLKNIENDLNDFHQGKIFPFEDNDEFTPPAHSVGRDA